MKRRGYDMTSIIAHQLIYTNVEADQSPTNRRGYQTLFYSHKGLSEAEVQNIEPRLFYITKEKGLKKHVFFRLDTGKIVVSQIVPLSGTDKFGRTGRYFAHALIFLEKEFQKVQNNPFAIFDNFQFLTSVEQALEKGDITTGNISTIEIQGNFLNPATTQSQLIKIIEPSQFLSLLLLAARAPKLMEERRAIVFLAPPHKIMDFIREFFKVLPPPLRLQCYFDTYFVEGSITHLPYWAVGLPTEQPQPANLIPFDIAQGRFLIKLPLEPENAFEHWLVQLYKQQKLDIITHLGTSAFYLGEWFKGRKITPDLLKLINKNLIQNFIELNRKDWESRILTTLKKQAGNVLGERIFPRAISWLEEQGEEALLILQRGFGKFQLERWVYTLYANSTRQPEPEELQDLYNFATRNNHRRLYWQCLRWSRKWKQLAKELNNAGEDEFLKFADWAIKTVPIQNRWKIRKEKQGIFFGIEVIEPQSEIGDTQQLLFALLGGVKESPGIDDSLNSAEIEKKSRNIFGFIKKQQPITSNSDGITPQVLNPTRWIILMDLLTKNKQ